MILNPISTDEALISAAGPPPLAKFRFSCEYCLWNYVFNFTFKADDDMLGKLVLKPLKHHWEAAHALKQKKKGMPKNIPDPPSFALLQDAFQKWKDSAIEKIAKLEKPP